MRRMGYFFLLLTVLSIYGMSVLAKDQESELKSNIKKEISSVITEQSTPSSVLQSLLSALGGFGGGGLLLMFFIRRLINNYDEMFAKWENRCHFTHKESDKTNDKLISLIKDVQDAAQDLKVEIIKLQVNAVDKNAVTEALTKIAMFEADLEQVRGELGTLTKYLLKMNKNKGLDNENISR